MWCEEVNSSCIDINAFNYFNSLFMVATNLILYTMSLLFTWKLHLRRSQRITVNFLFALGGLVLAASGARVSSVYKQARKPDFTYRFATIMICAVIKNHIAVIVACAPSIIGVMLRAFSSLQSRFEKMVSRDTKQDEVFRSSEITSMNVEAATKEEEA